jgi:polyhydroxyalkanoate synthase
MADKLMQPTWDPLVLAAQLQKIAKQSQTLMQRFVSNQPAAIKLGIGDTSSLGFSRQDNPRSGAVKRRIAAGLS